MIHTTTFIDSRQNILHILYVADANENIIIIVFSLRRAKNTSNEVESRGFILCT